MTPAEQLRQARESRGWSRFRLTVIIKDQFRKEGVTLSEQTIKQIETQGIFPRATTWRILRRIFPELTQTYPPPRI